MPAPDPLATAVTRRAGLGLGLLGAALLTSGCDLDDLGGAAPVPGGDAPTDPDEQVVTDIRSAVAARLSMVAATRQTYPRLQERLAPLESMHRAHLAALTPKASSAPQSGSPTPTAVVVPPSPARASRRVLAGEVTHLSALATAATTARSGALARLLGSMSAGVAGHLAALGAPPAPTPPSGAPVAPTAADLDALQVTLAGEHAAVYVYGVLGARTSESGQPTLFGLLQAAYADHRDLRDLLIGTVAATGATPVAAAAAYVVPTGPGLGVDDPEQVTATAVDLESGCGATYASQVGAAVATTREQAVDWLQETAGRLVGLGQPPVDLPGVA